MAIVIRKGEKEDIDAVFDLIMELAIYEKAPEEVENTKESMLEDGFGSHPVFGFFVAEDNKVIVGLALYYINYSTWKGKSLFLEDLVITESYRKKGIGQLLFDAIVGKAKEINAGRLSWQVLEWNTPAIGFYKKLNAHFLNDWITCKLTKEQIQNYRSSDSNNVRKVTN